MRDGVGAGGEKPPATRLKKVIKDIVFDYPLSQPVFMI
jgi:hypothetical protein